MWGRQKRRKGRKRRPKTLPVFLLDDEPEKLLRATRKERDRVLFMSMLYLGLRVGECCKWEVPDIDFGRAEMTVRHGKGNKQRPLPIPKRFLPILRGCVGPRVSGPVFLSRQGGSLSPRRVQLLIKETAVRAGLPGATEWRRITPHKLRHAFAMRFLERGGDIRKLQAALGHSDLITTLIYLRASPSHLRDAMEI